ncbi:hypothetical protein [Iamia sp.]|uniref:hypothetical protein n=1 Tax=Iamia sp. TaxID=2722710 RepID=UPI002C05EAEA|nr:hypothetical protein [Iamia sp.]HXH57687.1 hypothetical protein [Iamia sp.]
MAAEAIVVRPKISADAFEAGVSEKVDRLIAVYGASGLAALLGASRSQPTRWRAGHERPARPTVQRLLALDFLTSRLAEVFTARQTEVWLDSPNPYLGGAAPARVFIQFGGSAVEPAISAVEVGAVV